MADFFYWPKFPFCVSALHPNQLRILSSACQREDLTTIRIKESESLVENYI